MAEPGLLARWFGRAFPPSTPPAGAPGGAGLPPVNQTMEGAIPVNWPENWWQRGMWPAYGDETATVNACVNAYAQTLAQLPGAHYRDGPDGDPVKITTSALSRILRTPNSYQTRSDFMLNAVCDLMFVGNAYAWAERNNRQEVAALHLMPARAAHPYIEPESRSVFYGLGSNPLAGQLDFLIPQRDVLHIRARTHPGQPLRGIAPIEWALSSRAANAAITGSQAAFYAKASQPSGVLSTDQLLSKEQMDRLREAWRAHAAGVAAGDVPVLGGNLKWVPMGMTAQDAQLIEAFSMTVADIARAFSVPLPIIGDLAHSRSTFNNVEQLIGFWLATGLGFWVEHIEIAFDAFFGLPLGEYTEFDTDSLLRTQFTDRIDGLTKGITGGLYSPNEARRKEGLGKVAFGDEPRLQAQVVPLSQVAKIPPASSAPAPGNPGGPPANDNPADDPQADPNAPPAPDPQAAPAPKKAIDQAELAEALAVQGAAVLGEVRTIVESLAPPPLEEVAGLELTRARLQLFKGMSRAL